MRVINADGSEASMCGNGLRTVARYLAEKFDQDEFQVDTRDANLLVRRQPDFAPGVPALPLRSHPSALTKKPCRLTIWAMNGCLIRWFPSLFLDCVLPASRFLIHI